MGTQPVFPPLPIAALTCPTPRILWIELTSKCPFDCVFCSRKTLRGAGEHMDFDLYRSLIESLEEPEIIRLNYSGESAHYPYLIEAIELAHQRGAFVELVTAFASYPQHKIDALVESGLDRLTVSLHTLDEKQFDAIYRYSSLAEMKSKLAALRGAQQRLGRLRPLLDFAFVALQENLAQLPGIAGYARELGVSHIAIHPLIRRDEIPVQFPLEIEGTRLRPGFIDAMSQAVDRARADFPDIRFNPSTCELASEHELNAHPQYTARPLPDGARIFSCDQSPWDSVHVLANGDVVTCEARDKTILGNLRTHSLPEIWHGEAYQQFRRVYQDGHDAACRACPYKLAYLPGPLRSAVAPGEGPGVELVSGWHGAEGSVIWSKRRSRALLNAGAQRSHPRAANYLEVDGVLPAAAKMWNELTVWHGGQVIGSFRNSSAEMRPFHLRVPFQEPAQVAQFDFVISQPLRPADSGSEDVRELGFALRDLRVTRPAPTGPSPKMLPRWRFVPLYLALKTGARLASLLRRVPTAPRRLPPWHPGISIVIPERATPGPLEGCLASAYEAIAQVAEPCEVIVMVNGAPPESYDPLRAAFPQVRWLHSEEPLGFSGAVARGISAAQFDWVYLLNSDMVLAPQAIAEAARWRGSHIFAIGSQIHFADSQRRREETGWTDFRTRPGTIEIFDFPPADSTTVRGHLYAGGGAALFRRLLLQRFMSRWHPYNPVYWEDVEWGLRAWRAGYEVLFCPASETVHLHRATVSQIFPPLEIERILRRNQLLFLLRNGFPQAPPRTLVQEMRRGWDPVTQREVASLRQAASLLAARLSNALAPAYAIDLQRLRQKYYLHPPSAPTSAHAQRPVVIVVSPFAVYPPAHGGARRIASLIRHLSRDFDIVLLADEDSLYQTPASFASGGPVAIHLTGGRVEKAGEIRDRIARIRLHSHDRIAAETERLATVYSASLVHIEYVELAALIEKKRRRIPWILTLHDVLLSADPGAPADQFEAALIAKYDAAIVCSGEDAALVRHPRLAIVPNGLDLRPAYRPSRGSRRILFMGPFRYAPNLEGIRRFLETVYPVLRREIPDVTLQILGGRDGRSLAARFACFRQPGIQIVDHTDDVEPWLSACALTINPLGEMRGSSIKLLESIAAGRVCVSTLEGARGFRDLPSEALVIVPRIEDFIGPLRELLMDEEQRVRREQPADKLLQALSWQQSAAIQADIYRSLAPPRA